jgi:hypothetical protein
MKELTIISRVLLAIPLMMSASAAYGQPAPAGGGSGASRAIGEVKLVAPADGKISLKTDAGETIDVLLDAKTAYLKVPPGQVTLDKADNITLSEVGVGDRVLAWGAGADGKALRARQVIVMTKGDIQHKRAEEKARWQERGLTGVITTISPDRREAVLQARERGAVKVVTIAFTENTRFRRYAPDSINFEDAQSGSLADIKVGDQVRALAEKSSDGGRAAVEEIVSGAFLTASGNVLSVNPETGEVKISLLSNHRPLTVTVGKGTKARRLSPPLVALLVQNSLAPTTGQPQQGAPAGAPRAPDLQESLERLPQIPITEIKPGEIILVSSTKGADPANVTAITILAGMDAVFNQLQARANARARTAPNPNTGLPPGVLDLVVGLP